MAITGTTANNYLMGLSSDTKPTTDVYLNTLFLELDTKTFYYFTGTAWVVVGQSENRQRTVKKT